MSARRALITGATGGFGRAIARELAADGVNLALTGRDASAVSVLADEIHEAFPDIDVRALTCDLAREDEARLLIAKLEAGGAAPDVLVNNAAIQGPIGPFVEATWQEWAATVMVDLLAPAHLTRLVLPAMLRRKWGRVINISGGGATGPRPDFSAYAVAKTGLVRFTETMAHELAGSGVTINAVAPGPMNTRMLDEVLQAGPARASREFAAAEKRARDGGVSPADAATLVGWLASDHSARVSGRLLSAVWDPWERCAEHADALERSDIYTLRRIVPKDRGQDWGDR